MIQGIEKIPMTQNSNTKTCFLAAVFFLAINIPAIQSKEPGSGNGKNDRTGKSADSSDCSTAPLVACAPTRTPPVIDGELTDQCWPDSMECASFLLTQDKGLARAQTSVRLTYDQKKLYVAFRCAEPYLDPVMNQMERFKAEVKTRDAAVGTDDCVEVFLQPPDQTNVYHLIVNSKGVVFDESNQGGRAWNAEIEAKGRTAKDDWTLEMAIPFDSLGVAAPSAGQTWRGNFCRARQPVSEFSSWAPVARAFNTPESFGFFRFVEATPGMDQDALKFSKEGEASFEARLRNHSSRESDYRMSLSIVSDNKANWNTEKEIRLAAGAEQEVHVKQKVVPDRDPLKKYEDVSSFCDLQYSLTEGRQVYYRSARFRQKFGQASQPIASQLSYHLASVEAKLLPLDGFYVVEGAAERMVLTLSGTKPDEIKQAEWVLEVPAFCTLISPLHRRECVSPQEVVEEPVTRNGTPYRRYRMTFEPTLVARSGDLAWDFLPIPLFLRADGAPAETPLRIYFHARARLGESEHTEKDHSLPLVVLPAYSQKRPLGQMFSVWSHTPYFDVTQHSDAEEAAIFDQWTSAGFTIVATEFELTLPRYRQLLRDRYGMQLKKMAPVLTAGSFPGALEYVKAHPSEAEQILTGKPANAVCLADMLDGTSGFLEQVNAILGPLARAYDWLDVDYEFGIFNNNAIGYSARNLEMFRKRENLASDVPLTPETLQGRFRNEWVDFRCWQNGEMLKVYQDAIRKSHGRAKLSAYSAYQREGEKRANYGVDWRYMGRHCDLVMCGYGRSGYEATRAAIGPAKDTCAGMAAWSEDNPPELAEQEAFRCISDLGGLMYFYDGLADGRSWRGISRASAVAADFHEFFPPQRADRLAVDPVTGAPLPEVSVLTHGEERLVFVFNETDKPRTLSFLNKDLPNAAAGINYWTKEAVALTGPITTTVGPHSVAVFYLCSKDRPKEEGSAPQTVAPNPEHPPRSLRPVFIWADAARTGRFALEYREAGNNKTTVAMEGIPETVCQARAGLIPGKKYEWRVRSQDVISGAQTPWSAWQSFAAPTILNADVVPRILAPGGAAHFQADGSTDGDWQVFVKTSDGSKRNSFDGKGHSIALTWEAKDEKGNPLPEGRYTAVFQSGKGSPVEVPFEVDIRRGSANPSVERLGPWRLIEWGAYYPDEANPSDRDYEVSRSGSYSLRIQKNQIKDHAPYWGTFRREATGVRLPKVNPGETYRFTVWVKTKGPGVRAVASIRFLNEAKIHLAGKSAASTGEHDWQELTVDCPVPAGAVRLTLNLGCDGGNAGTAWFDDFTLKQLPIKY